MAFKAYFYPQMVAEEYYGRPCLNFYLEDKSTGTRIGWSIRNNSFYLVVAKYSKAVHGSWDVIKKESGRGKELSKYDKEAQNLQNRIIASMV